MRTENTLQLMLLLIAYVICQEASNYAELIDYANEIILKFILKPAQQTIHSLSEIVLKKLNKNNNKIHKNENYLQSINDFRLSPFNRHGKSTYNAINKLLDCHLPKTYDNIMSEELKINEWVKNFGYIMIMLETKLTVVQNRADRLVMNGSRNFTEKCELLSDKDDLLQCLEIAAEEAQKSTERLFAEMRQVLSQFRMSICNILHYMGVAK